MLITIILFVISGILIWKAIKMETERRYIKAYTDQYMKQLNQLEKFNKIYGPKEESK